MLRGVVEWVFQGLRGAVVAACLVTLLFGLDAAGAQEPNFRRIDVGSRVSLDAPSHWHIRDLDERRNIAAAGEALIDATGPVSRPIHVSALSVVSKPDPPGAIVRVSFLPIEMLTQADVVRMLRADRTGTMREVAQSFREDMVRLSKALEPQGIKILGEESVGTDSIGGVTAFTLSYGRTSAVVQSTFAVTQYHVPLGTEKVLITLSYRESEALLYRPIIERIKSSVVVR